MIVRKIGIMSAGKISGILYAAFGLLAGLFMAMLGMFISLIPSSQDIGPFGFLFGFGAIIILPITYGFIGFVGGIITAALYNVASGVVGGLEVETEDSRPTNIHIQAPA